MNYPEVTVAVCVLNGALTIGACLKSLQALDYPGEKLTILLVDNGSSDNTVAIADIRGVPVVSEPVRGRGHARNRAWKTCTTPFLAFTDADCRVAPDWLTQIMPAFEDKDAGVAGGPIMTPGESLLARFFEARQVVSNREFSGDYPLSPPFLATANAVFRMDALNKAEGFAVDFIVAEDADVSWRIQDAGYTIRYVPEGTVFHHHRTTVSGMFRQAREYGFDGVAVCLRHRRRFPGPPWIWWGLYARFLWSIMRIPFSPFARTGEKSFALLDTIRYFGLILGRLRAAWVFRFFVL